MSDKERDPTALRKMGKSLVKQGRRLKLNGWRKWGRRLEFIGARMVEFAKKAKR